MIPQGISAKMSLAILASVGFAMLVHFGFSADNSPRLSPAAGGETTNAEAQIWALEQAYWEFNRDAKHDEIIGTWHEQFLGWPAGEPSPIDKDSGTRYVRRNYAEPASYAFEIQRAGIRIVGNVAVNHYAVRLTEKDGRQRSLRITHTLLRDNDGWKILGGMSASQ